MLLILIYRPNPQCSGDEEEHWGPRPFTYCQDHTNLAGKDKAVSFRRLWWQRPKRMITPQRSRRQLLEGLFKEKNKLINTIPELMTNYHWWWLKYIAINSRPIRLWPGEDDDDEALRTSNLDVWHQLAQEGQTFSSSSSRFCRVWKIFSHQFLKLCSYKVEMLSMFLVRDYVSKTEYGVCKVNQGCHDKSTS